MSQPANKGPVSVKGLITFIHGIRLKLGTEAGQVVSQTEQAVSEEELRHRLTAEGFYVFSVARHAGLGGRVLNFRRGRISPDDFLIFNQQFLTLSKSGLPLQKSLDLLVHQTRSEQLRSALEAALREVRAGKLLSEAFEATGGSQDLFCHAEAGERGGSLDQGLSQYVVYQKTAGLPQVHLGLIYTGLPGVLPRRAGFAVITFIVPSCLLYSDWGGSYRQ
jgi:hypothetical protein